MPDETPKEDKPTAAEHEEQKELAEELKGKKGVRNPYGLAWWITRRDKDKRE